MKKLSLAAALSLAFAAPTVYGDREQSIRVDLIGYEEVPAVSTTAFGRLRVTIAENQDSMTYTLRYRGLQGTVTMAHIHLGQRGVNGGIVLWLCDSATNPAPTQLVDCPVADSQDETVEVSGTLDSGDVVAIGAPNAGQQIAAGEWEEVLRAIRAGVTYANVHTTLSPGGEIRGQLRGRGGHDHD